MSRSDLAVAVGTSAIFDCRFQIADWEDPKSQIRNPQWKDSPPANPERVTAEV